VVEPDEEVEVEYKFGCNRVGRQSSVIIVRCDGVPQPEISIQCQVVKPEYMVLINNEKRQRFTFLDQYYSEQATACI
jgi:hypothetical protein